MFKLFCFVLLGMLALLHSFWKERMAGLLVDICYYPSIIIEHIVFFVKYKVLRLKTNQAI
jgi:hypothetical protein